MKKSKKILFILSLASMTALTACGGSSKPEDPVKPDEPVVPDDPVTPDDPVDPVDPVEPEEVDPIYGDVNYFEGTLNANFPISSAYSLSLINTNISFAYQAATNIDQIDYYKAAKFHLNLDLYSDETNFQSSMLTQFLPKIFSDFKYTKILNNVSDFDIYYLGDGYLYATLSNFEGEEPDRNDKDAVKNASRNVLNVTRMDVKAIINTIAENFDSFSDKDITSTLISIGSMLNGTRFDVEAITKIFMYSYFTILEGGFNFELKEEGAKYLSSLVNNSLVSLLSSTFGMSLPSDTQIINISKLVLECTTSKFMINVENKDATKPLFKFSIESAYSDAKIEAPIDFEEKYYSDKEIIDKIDDLYLGYENFQLDDTYIKEYQKLIDEVNAFKEEDFAPIGNFNKTYGYQLLDINEDGTYGFLSMYDTILSEYEALKEGISNLKDTDKSRLELFEVFETFYYDHISYSEYLKDNILNKIKSEDPSKYEAFLISMNNFFNSKLKEIVTTVSSKINDYNLSSESTLEDAYKILNDSYSLLYNDWIVCDGFDIWDSSDLDDSSVIEAFSNSAYYDFYNASCFDPYVSNEFSSLLYDFVSDYLAEISFELDKIDENNLDDMNQYSTALVISNTTKLDKIFNLADIISSTSYESGVNETYNNIINSLVSKVDSIVNNKIDEIITEDKIYKLNHKEKVEACIELLDETYNSYYNTYINGDKLLKKYKSNFTCITKYKTLKALLEEELSYYND